MHTKNITISLKCSSGPAYDDVAAAYLPAQWQMPRILNLLPILTDFQSADDFLVSAFEHGEVLEVEGAKVVGRSGAASGGEFLASGALDFDGG
jgi:hypothetical protein